MRHQKGNFVVVPNLHILEQLSSDAQAIYIWLCRFSNDDGLCFPSVNTLARKTHISERQVRNIFTELEDKHLIKIIPRKQGKRNLTNVYQLYSHEMSSTAQPAGGTAQPAGGVLHTVQGELEPVLTETTYITANAEENDLTYEQDEDYKRNGFKRKPDDDNSRVIMEWAENSTGRKFPQPKRQMSNIRQMLDSKYSAQQIKDKWAELSKDEFWSSKGIDFGIVLANIFKKSESKKRVLLTDNKN